MALLTKVLTLYKDSFAFWPILAYRGFDERVVKNHIAFTPQNIIADD